MKTYGFEKEFFVLRGPNAEPVIAADLKLPFDGCGYLAEVRGDSHQDPIKAHFLYQASLRDVLKALPALNCIIDPGPRKLPKAFTHECMRRFGKVPQSDFSMSGRWNNRAGNLCHAGLHVHFGFQTEIEVKDGRKQNVILDVPNIPRIIYLLDQQFKKRIKDSKRAPGLYKLKPYGFEYRSLPASIDTLEVAEFLSKGI